MILGSLTFSPDGNTSSIVEETRRMTDYGRLKFHQVILGGFKGGYYLHPRLPFELTDFYYYDEGADILVLLSGSIYNKPELLSFINIETPAPDPILIAGLFQREGSDFVKRLNGDFAIFILMPIKKQAYLFRDHVGIRPLAWATDRQSLIFSSDIVGLSRSLSGGHSIDSDYLLGYFKFIDYRRTPCEQVNKLLPGHFLYFTEKGIEIRQYWNPGKIKTDKKLSYDRMLSDLKAIIHDSVKIRCDHRFIAGAHVSSGLDSGLVSSLARRGYQKQEIFYGFSWSPGVFVTEEVKYDERKLVIKSCEKTDIQPLFSEINRVNFPQIVSSFYDNHGFFSEDNTIEQAIKVSTNLIFSGWGGDEFISSGDRGIDLDLLLGMKLRSFFRRNSVNKPKKFIKKQLFYVIYPALGILDRGIAKSFRDDARYIKNPFWLSDRKAISNFYFHKSRHQLHLRLLQFYHIQERCESWMINGFRKGVEYRYPLLDKRIIEYMLKVPSELLCKTDHFRPILRVIGEGVLHEEVRLNHSKNDPVYWSWMDKLFCGAAIKFMEEVGEWKVNRDLSFIDFDLLKQDIKKYKSQSLEIDSKVLFRALVYLKAIHEFTLAYRK